MMEVRIRYKHKNKSSDAGSNEGGHSQGGASRREAEQDVGLSEEERQLKRMYHFTNEQLTALKDTFAELDKAGSGVIPVHQLGTALRCLRQAPTEAELVEMVEDAKLDDTGCLTLSEYFRLIGSRGLKARPELEFELADALRFFDKDGRGLLNVEYLRTALRTHGEPLEEEDIAEMMRLADVKGDGRFNYGGL